MPDWSTGLWLLLIVGLVFWRPIVGTFVRRQPPAPQAHLPGPGTFSFEVVGEASYQDALAAICGPPTRDGHEVTTTATLLLEDDNPYDNKAVAVTIEGRLVGYLPRALAREYRARLAETGHPYALCTCPALIRGGWDRGPNNRGPFGVLLDLPGGKPGRRKKA